ncbi:MAG: hypothetical protein ACD_3C00099G0003 [uncultured bacterium (gcode 4)]|uniref:Uncharacterized protein n=1 Tax=uncultured bacterium (gcode 4) TaxID=1234023 RepID=K2GD18_9BACT|nr:MAG: hypothetical protein ACD_3C00099G0003 [uncultured bacterium (gcode 4)]
MSEALDNHTWNLQEQEALYRNGSSEQYKQDYWNRMFCANWWRSETDDFPINLSEYRSKISPLEPNFDRFIPWIMLALGNLGFSWTVDDIFILDNDAKKFLDGRLVENLWDLYYNTLADFLEELCNVTWIEKLKKASEKIRTAWKISEPYIDKTNPPKKHENAEIEVWFSWWITAVAERIWNMDKIWLWNFLLALSQKIWNDWEKDNNRPSLWKDWVVSETRKRTQLATALFEASSILKEEWKILTNS